jgi:ATP-dependent DNA helicase RecQ
VLDAPILGRLESPDITYLLHPRKLAHPGKPGTTLADIHAASISIRTALRTL